MILTRPLRKPFWIVSSFVKKHQRLILVATGLGFFLFLFTKNLIPFLPRPKSHLKIGLVGQYNLQTLPLNVSQQISRGLTQINSRGDITPDLAETWEILEQETLYRFYLKPGLQWSDGSLIKAKDISYNIPDVEVSYPDDKTIEFRLKEPFSPFLTVMSKPIFKRNIIGAGDYLIKNIDYRGQHLKLLNLAGSKQNLSYKFYASNQTAWIGFKLGEVDRLENLFINPLNDQWLKKVSLEETINCHRYLAILFNLSDNLLSDKNLRQALAYAIETKNPNGQRALSPFCPNSWAYNPKVKPYQYSPKQAKTLFEKLIEEQNEDSLNLPLNITLSTSQSFLDLAESIKNSWQDVLDIKVEVKIVNTIEPGFQALLIAQEIPLDPDQHALWHSTQPTNITHYSDLRVDKLLEDGRMISDPAKRKEIYQDFQRFLVEDSPAIFLEYPTTYTIERK